MSHNEPQELVTLEEVQFLNDFLTRQEQGMNVFVVHGFLTGVISTPVEVPASDWFPFILHRDLSKPIFEQPPLFQDDAEAQKVIMIVHNLKEQITQILKSTKLYRPLVSLDNPKLPMQEAPLENAQDWCNGYLAAVDGNREAWSKNEKVFVPLVAFAVVSGSYPYEELVQGLGKFLKKEEDIKFCMETIPDSVKSIYRSWHGNPPRTH